MNPVLSCLTWLVLMPLSLAAALLPRSWELGLGKRMGRLALTLDPRRRKIAEDNIRRCLPELGPSGQKELLRENYEHMGILTLELLHMYAPIPGHYRRYVEKNAVVDNFEVYDRLNALGRGTIVVTGHFANWEMMGIAAVRGMKGLVTGKRVKPEWLNTMVVNARRSLGVGTASGRRILPELIRWTKSGNTSVFILDQYAAPPAGVPVEFFGIKVDTQSAVGLVAARTKAPIFMVYQRRDAEGIIHDVFEEAVLTAEELEDPVLATQALALKIEAWLRKNPSQWLWVHRRFKNVAWPAERLSSRP